MTADPESQPEPTPAYRRIVIDVVRTPMPDFLVRFENVTPAEVFGAAWMLDQLAREVRTQQVMSSAQGQPVVPSATPDQLAAMIRAMRG